MHTTLVPGAQMLFRRKWRKWDKIHFYFIVLVIIVASINGTIFSHLWVIFLIEVLLYCFFTKSFAIVFQNWFDHDWIDSGVFLIECASFCCRHTCKNWSLEKSLKFFFQFGDKKFFRDLVWEEFWCVPLLCPSDLAIRFSNNDWGALSMQSVFTFYNLPCSGCDQMLWSKISVITITSENQLLLFTNFVLFVFWGSNSYTVIFVFWVILMEPVNGRAPWWPPWCIRNLFLVGGIQKESWTF